MEEKVIVCTNGCFDILHDGHIKLLKKCNELGNHVIVFLNSDHSIIGLKKEIPKNPTNTRKQNLLKTGLVNEVLIFENEEVLSDLYKIHKPEFLVKGSDYKNQKIVGSEYAKNVVLVDLITGLSSSKIKTLQDRSFLITGGLGFIGSNLIKYLNNLGINKIDIVDNLNDKPKWRNVIDCKYQMIYDSKHFYELLMNKEKYNCSYDYIIHLGACSDTHEKDFKYLNYNNVHYSIDLLQNIKCDKFIYASSAATYGLEQEDFTERIEGLIPANPYGYSKLLLDRIIFEYLLNIKSVYGLRFFNVYGPNEWHKGKMISFVSKTIHEEYSNRNNENFHIKKGNFPEGELMYEFQLFKSNSNKYLNGEQKRDFIYVEDVCKVIFHFIINDEIQKGIYNVGTGNARSFNDICKIINPNREIHYIDIPLDTSKQYQNFTEANLTKLRNIANYKQDFLSLEEGIEKIKKMYE